MRRQHEVGRWLAAGAGLATAAGVVLAPASASAAAPSHDDASGATQVASLPFAATADLRQATDSATETRLRDTCSDDAPAPQAHGVWYRYTPTYTRVVHAEGSGRATVLAAQGPVDDLQPVDGDCGRSLRADGMIVRAGTPYFFLLTVPDGDTASSTTFHLVDSGCGADQPRAHDLDGDHCPDLAVALPRTASVEVRYGSTMHTLAKRRQVLRLSTQTGAGSGMVVTTGDVDGDGYLDLVVGLPSLDVSGRADAGGVQVVYGSATGLGAGRATRLLTESTQRGTGSPEVGDRFGAAVSVSGAPRGRLAIGVPGESLGSTARAGAVVVLTAGSASGRLLSQSGSAPGTPRTGDAYGSAVAFDGTNLLVGVPLDDLGSAADAGSVTVVPAGGGAYELTQDTRGMPGVAEAGDRFGAAFAVLRYADGTRVAVGVPGESIGSATRTGSVNLLTRAAGTARLHPDGYAFHQGSAHVPGGNESGDHFGAVLVDGTDTVVDSVRSYATVHLLVGVPDEDLGATADAGTVLDLPFADSGSRGASARRSELVDGSGTSQGARSPSGGSASVPGSPGRGNRFGASLAALPGDVRAQEDRTVSVWAGVPGQDVAGAADAGLVQRADDVEPVAGDALHRIQHLERLRYQTLYPAQIVRGAGYGGSVG
ncbi:FG-GAP repeat domain-containing protein [Angustibacter aerolatus]